VREFLLVIILGIFISCTGNDIPKDAGSSGVYERGRIYGQITGLPENMILLFELYGDQSNLLDSVYASGDGSFEFIFPPERQKGLYRLIMGENVLAGYYDRSHHQLDLIWDGSTVVFHTHFDAPADSMEVILSEENRLYYQLLNVLDNYYEKIGTLSNALIHYPPDDNFYRRLERQYRRVQNRRSNYIDNQVKSNSGKIFASIARFHKMPRITTPVGDTGINEMKESFFFKGQFSDPVLLRTDLIPGKIMRFLSLHAGGGLDHMEQQEELIKAVDVIMQHAGENEEVFYFIVEYLINIFGNLDDMDIVTEHLTDHYLLGGTCLQGEGSISRPAGGAKLRQGVKVPAFSFTAMDGRAVDLYNIEAEYTVILFWGSWCPHCDAMMDDLYRLYAGYRETRKGFLEIIAIGIEDNETEWRNYIESKGYDWINYSAFKDWDCPVALDYDLSGTPTMVLLDHEKRFLQEPLRVRTLERHLSGRR
jgi:thiol-disulfide isomerase/thioredoxin